MNFKNWFKKSPALAEPVIKKSFSYSLSPDSFLAQAFAGGTITANKAMLLYRSTAAVATAVDMIADPIEQIKPVLEMPDGKFVSNHPVLDLLNKPNGFSNWNLFIGELARNYLLKHDSLITSVGNVKRPPIECWPVNLQVVSIMQAMDGYPASYMVSNGVLTGVYERVEGKTSDATRFYEGRLKELYHIKGFSSRYNHLESDSPLEAAAMEAQQIIKGKYHNVKLLENGGRLSLMITFNDDDYVTDDEHQERVQRLNEQWGGVNNTGKIGVVSGADVQHVKEFGKSNKDMDFAVLETLAGQAIYLRYKIPLSLVTTDASTFNNMKTGVELLYDNAIIPTITTLMNGLSHFMLPRFKLDPLTYRITYNPEDIEPLKNRKLDELLKRRKINIETPNELRATIPGLEALPGEDELSGKPSEADSNESDENSDNDDKNKEGK